MNRLRPFTTHPPLARLEPLVSLARSATLRAAPTLALALAMACTAAQATTYQYNGGAYSTRVDPTAQPCTAGACANFAPGTAASGTFTTTAPLAASLPPSTDIAPDITAFSFSDGLTRYSSSDPSTHLMRAYATTDASGAITAIDIYVQRWQTGSAQAVGGRVDTLVWGHASASAYHNIPCSLYNGLPGDPSAPGAPCMGFGDDANVSYAVANTGAIPFPVASPAAAAPVPTLHPAALLGTGMLAWVLGAAALRASSRPGRRR